VAEKHAELERNYERLNALERERATAAERERLVRDMHDGLGGQLVSTLALVESGRFTAGALATAIREALDDLRLMIDSMDPGEEDIVGLLAQIRSRLEPRLVDRGIRFDWQVSDLPPLPELTPGRALQVLRIVQEAITNVLKHSGASCITVRTGVAADVKGRSAYVEIADDGRGLDASRPTGRGIENMRRRAQAAGGCLSLHSGSGGTTVRLDLGLGPAA
jgi:signal transduction histidine kinase